MRPLRLYYYRRKDCGRNFGDDLSPLIVAAVAGRAVEHATIARADLAAIGSILDRVLRHRVRRLLRGRRDPLRIWGSGFISEGPARSPRMLDVLAVRGPLTRARFGLGDGVALGDPGILAGELLPGPVARRHRWGVVAHHEDEGSPPVAALCDRLPGSVAISVSGEPLATLRAIAACEMIASSSLHGLIAADALGIPNWRVSFARELKGGDFKFRDYALVVGREHYATTPSGAFDPASAPSGFGYQQRLGPHQDRLRSVLRAAV